MATNQTSAQEVRQLVGQNEEHQSDQDDTCRVTNVSASVILSTVAYSGSNSAPKPGMNWGSRNTNKKSKTKKSPMSSISANVIGGRRWNLRRRRAVAASLPGGALRIKPSERTAQQRMRQTIDNGRAKIIQVRKLMPVCTPGKRLQAT